MSRMDFNGQRKLRTFLRTIVIDNSVDIVET